MNFNKVIFRPIELLKLIGSWFPERAAKIYSVLSRVNQQSPLQQYSLLFVLRQSHVDLMAFQTIDNNVRMSQELDFRLILTYNNNDKSLIPTNAPRFSLSAIFLLGIFKLPFFMLH